MLAEFEQSVANLSKQVAVSQTGFKTGFDAYHAAEESYNSAVIARDRLLQNILSKKGLAVCSSPHTNWQQEGVEHPTAEQLGIYPRGQMRLLFHKEGPYPVRGEYDDTTETTTLLHLCCPEHFPTNQEWVSKKIDGFTYITSEVVQQNGKFILLVDGSDITELAKKRGLYIEPKGRKPSTTLDQATFEYFGIPNLPEKPDLNRLQRSW